ncbi:hypothetical protein C8J57DRAFT_1135088 [Mycena rebaudengoi]|nr:hypothetical protein C8J57DRAFT_1135088 [Mycena rebaudengoi]
MSLLTAKVNKKLCLRIIDRIHQFHCAVINTYYALKGDFPLKMIDSLAQFLQTLNKVQGCLYTQQDLGKLQRFFKLHEVTAQLETCESEIQMALNILSMRSAVGVSAVIVEMEIDAQRRHEELLALIETQSDGKGSEYSASIRRGMMFQDSRFSVYSLLPVPPQIFHGREAEVSHIVSILLQDQEPAHLAILGPGGMGKTSLAKSALHHPDVVSKYKHRHFISCESANTDRQLIDVVGTHLGLEPARNLSQAIVEHLKSEPTLLLLDNFETPWEDLKCRNEVEEFLSLLTDVPHLALLLTMRGAERPGKVKWTRPFLSPLSPLPLAASRQTFIDIADDPSPEDQSSLAELIELTGNLPLALNLMANVVSYEGYTNCLLRWKQDQTAVLSEGHDRLSNLEKSIMVSLASPRLTSTPEAKALLGLLSLLPDGISDRDLQGSNLPISNLGECKSLLLRTSLAYRDPDERLRILSPISEYIRRTQPPPESLTESLRKYWQSSLALWESRYHVSHKGMVPQILQNLGNITGVLQYGLANSDETSKQEIFEAILTLQELCSHRGHSQIALLHSIPRYADFGQNIRLKLRYKLYCLDGYDPISASEADAVISEGRTYFKTENDVAGLVHLSIMATKYYYRRGDFSKALDINQEGLSVIMDQEHTSGDYAVDYTPVIQRANLEGQRHNAVEEIRYSQLGQKLSWNAGQLDNVIGCIIEEAYGTAALGCLPKALELCDRARQIMSTSGFEGSQIESQLIDFEAMVTFQKGEFCRTRKLYESLRINSSTQGIRYHTYASLKIAEINLILGDCKESDIIQVLTTMHDTSKRLDWKYGLLLAQKSAAYLDIIRGNVNAAWASYVSCFKLSREATKPDIIMECLEKLADHIYRMSYVEDTFHWAGTYLAYARKARDIPHTYQSLRCLGDIFLAWGDLDSALNIFYAVLDGSTEMGVSFRCADCMTRIGDIALQRGDVVEARKMWQDAHQLFLSSSLTREAAATQQRLAQVERKTISHKIQESELLAVRTCAQ